MAEESAKLRIPYIAAAQAQKHVTHNEALTLLDTLVQLSVLDKDLTAPPAEPDEGDCYIVAAEATGAWLGWDTRVARFIDGEWRSYLPGTGSGAGWLAWVLDEDAMYRFDGEAWDLAGIEGPEGPEGPGGADGDDGEDGQSFQPDAVAALIAGRDAYDDEAAAFSVLVVSDSTNGNLPTLYFKLSAANADWSDAITWALTGGGGSGENLIVNPDGRISQHGTLSTADGAYGALDQHYVLTQSGAVSSAQGTNGESGMPYFHRLTQSQASAQRIGNATPLLSSSILHLRGQDATLSLRARCSAAATLRFAILEHTGTADTLSRNVVNDWTSATYTAGNFFIGSDLTVAGVGGTAVSADSWTDLTALTAAISASMNNVIVVLWTEDTVAQDVTLDWRWKLESGSAATPFQPPSIVLETMRCKAFYQKSYADDVTPGTDTTDGIFSAGTRVFNSTVTNNVTTVFGVPMWTAPTITTYPRDGAPAGDVQYNTSAAGSNEATPNIFWASPSGFSIQLSGSGASGLTTGQACTIFYHWVADARL